MNLFVVLNTSQSGGFCQDFCGGFFFLRIIFVTIAKQFQFESFQFTDLLTLRESD